MQRLGFLLVAVLVLAAGCGAGSPSKGYLVPAGDPKVLDDTYDLMLQELVNERADDPADVLAAATKGQRMLYELYVIDDEIANGGRYQVYWNQPGGFIKSAVQAARLIGANHWANLVDRAGQELFPHGVPDSLDAQRHAIGCPDYCSESSLDSLDGEWSGGEFRSPLLRYVHAHPAEFYKP